jgi:hypothetical protein
VPYIRNSYQPTYPISKSKKIREEFEYENYYTYCYGFSIFEIHH